MGVGVRLLLLLCLALLPLLARADLIILASDDKGAVATATRAVQAAYGGRVELHSLGGSRARESEIVQAVQASGTQQVVAIGLLAAQVARQRLSGKQVVFCQVLNVEESNLVAPWMKGVSGIPSLARQFALWKQLDPNLRKIGVITGHNARYMVEAAEQAARPLGLEIDHVSVPGDRAVLSALQELRERRIQGLWLAPDSAILSQRTIMDVMAYSVKNNIEVLAFSPALLKEGALMSATADIDEIAHIVVERLKRAGPNHQQLAGEALSSLPGARISVSVQAASRFGLTLPPKLKEQADVQ